MAFPKVGNMAPKFSLDDHEGKTVSLSDYKGKSNVVVYFYPKAMTPGCTVQAQGLRDSAKALKNLDTVVLGISPDPVKKLAKFVERDELNFQLLSDRITPPLTGMAPGAPRSSWAGSSTGFCAPRSSWAKTASSRR